MFGVIRLATRDREKGQQQRDADTAASSSRSSSGVKKASTKRAITFIDYTPTLVNPRNAENTADKRRKDVRVHAAMASADKRKATIARKDAYGVQRRARLLNAIQLHQTLEQAVASQKAPNGIDVGPDTTAFDLLSDMVSELNADATWYMGKIERTSLPSKAIRSTLWGAVTNNSALFQAAVFVAGTHSNTCGLPPTAVHDLGSGMILLRGASLVAIQAAVVAAEVESLTPVAIAMLAGWERRFGDPESYAVHMRAWKTLALPTKALDENNLATLADLTLETFREGLDERAATAPVKSESAARLVQDKKLPPGFSVMNARRVESQSVMQIVRDLNSIVPAASDSISRSRRLGLENMAWNPCHASSCKSVQAQEELWDQDELSALYHVRAANISICALIIRTCHDYHNIPWVWDMDSALSVHTMSCQHLRTEALLGTPYARVAVWARFMMCATSRDPDRDELMRFLLEYLGLRTWPQTQRMLKRFLYPELVDAKCEAFFEVLTSGSTGTWAE